MTGFISPERSRYRLIDFLEQNCAGLFSMGNLTEAVIATYRLGENEVARLAVNVARAIGHLREGSISGLVHDTQGARYSIRAGNDPIAPNVFLFRISPHLVGGSIPEDIRTRSLVYRGRYDLVTGFGPNQLIDAVERTVEAIALMLDTLQQWVEDRLFLTVEALSEELTKGVYDILTELGDSVVDRGIVDVAVIGRARGWRIPNGQILQRAIAALRASPGQQEADVLAATFVATTLPRDQLLMAKALAAHQAIVLPFRDAPYVIAGSYFGIACQLLDGPQTNIIHPIYESPGLSVVLIYSTVEPQLRETIESHSAELEEFIRRNVAAFEVALEYVEQSSKKDTPSLLVAGPDLLAVLDEVTGRIRHKAEREAPPGRRRPALQWWKGRKQ